MLFFQKLFALLFGGLNDTAKWNALIEHVGTTNIYLVLLAIVFAETGLVVTPFLPGDSLLFAIGAVGAREDIQLNLPLITALLIVASIVGDAVNYTIGYHLGPAIFKKETGRFLNKKHLLRAHEFYEKYGGKTIFLARFIPIIRTFAPFVAGIGQMNYFRFAMYNVVGGVTWVLICIGAGFYFGQFAFVKDHFEAVIVAIVVISVLPMAWEFWRARQTSKRGGNGMLAA
ncbi:MAG: VTT domain-containing protein [Gemmataceae bacterium]